MEASVGTSQRLRAGSTEWLGLAVLSLPTLLVSVDMTVLYMALPGIGEDLLPSSSQLLWITDIYGFLIAGLLITMGTLGDRIGRRKLLMMGGAAFGAASALAAYSVNAEMLIATRAILGIAGATIMPSTLALISNMFRYQQQRAIAIAVWMAVYSMGMAIGPLLGGALLEHFWWGSVFLINVPLMLIMLVAAVLLLPEYRTATTDKLDLLSVVLSLAAILPTVYGIKRIATEGAGDVLALLTILAGVLVGVVFVRRQRRENSLLDLSLFRNALFSSAVVVLLVVLVIFGGVYLLFTQYLQLVAGLSPWEAGLWMLPSVLGIAVGNLGAPIIARRLRPALVCCLGLVIAAIGSLLFLRVGNVPDVVTVAIASAIVLFGLSPMMVLGIDLIVGSAPPENAGSAASVSETSGELGFALGVAILGSVAAYVYRSRLTEALPGGLEPAAVGVSLESLAGATAQASQLGPQLAGPLLDAAQGAFTHGMSVVGLIACLASAVLAVVSIIAFRNLQTSSEQSPAEHDGTAQPG